MKKSHNTTGMKFATLFILLCMLQVGMCQKITTAQNKNIGISLSSMISANGYGNQYTPMIYFKKNRRSYSAGPVIQNQKCNFSGFQMGYEYVIVGKDVPENGNSDSEYYNSFLIMEFRKPKRNRTIWSCFGFLRALIITMPCWVKKHFG